MTDFLRKFEPDTFYEDDFAGKVRVYDLEKPIFKKAIVAFAPPYPEYSKMKLPCADPYGPCSAQARVVEDEVAVRLFNNEEAGFTDFHELTWQELLRNSAEREEVVRSELIRYQLTTISDCRDYLESSSIVKKHWTLMDAMNDWSDVGTIDKLYKLVSIGISDSGPDGIGYLFLDFQNGWDFDHGVQVVTHGSRIITVGGMQEYLFESSDRLEKAAKIYQSQN